MEIVIIEDERLTADDLAETIKQVQPDAEIVAILRSVKEATQYLKAGNTPDLIFSDIQLGDGLSFEIFSSLAVTAPVIFCTAYDEYALTAFKANGIDYILKPFTSETIGLALQRYQSLRNTFSVNTLQQYEAILKVFAGREAQRPAALLIHHLDKILPVKLESIALFYLKNEVTHLLTFNGKVYCPNKSLDELERITGDTFFRINRQYLIAHKAVTGATNYLSRKLSVTLTVPFEEVITVSKEKAPAFLKWLSGI
jgi:DNA-binding LytR/AlgR family response regulator